MADGHRYLPTTIGSPIEATEITPARRSGYTFYLPTTIGSPIEAQTRRGPCLSPMPHYLPTTIGSPIEALDICGTVAKTTICLSADDDRQPH